MKRRDSIRFRLILTLLSSVIIPIIITGYIMMTQAESALLQEKQNKLFSYAHMLDNYLLGTYDDVLKQENALSTTRQNKIQVLNKSLKDYTDKIASTNPGLGIGYYSKELDAILTYGPSSEFNWSIGQSIFPGHEGYIVMARGEQRVQIGELVRGRIMNCMHPVIREGTVIGYIWSNELISDIEAQIDAMEEKVYNTIIIGLFCASTLAYFATKNIARDVETIKKGVNILHKDLSSQLPPLQGELGDIAATINHMANSLKNIRHHAESIASSTPNGLITLDNKGFITIYNKAAENIIRVPAEEVIDNHYFHIFEYWPEVLHILNNAYQGELYQNKELTVLISLRQVPVIITTSALVNFNQEQMGILVILQDITEKKKLEEQVKRADRLALIGELAAGIAHEVRNPLTAITGYLQLLTLDFSQDDPRKEFTEIVGKEIDRLNYLIDQLLYFSRPLPPNFTVESINNTIQETIFLLSNSGVRKRVLIKTDLSSSLPPVRIDTRLIKQVLMNIILNGIQSIADKGIVTIRTFLDVSTKHIVIEIQDTGVGIPQKDLPRIFDPFYTTKEKGTGLGLAVADKIMELHRGIIEVVSDQGKGTSFVLYLPTIQEVDYND